MNIVNVFSEEAMIEEQIFNKFTTTLEIPLEVRLGISEPHTKLPLAPNSQRLYDILDEIFVHAYRWHHGPSKLRAFQFFLEHIELTEMFADHNFSSIFGIWPTCLKSKHIRSTQYPANQFQKLN
ncbi:hypothetical protein TrVFT333_002813 [Trichoderma virens FT-333]|nr:hypothetical protein TrVFT333_002813 [Trichoderma virens FT-333]